MKLSLKDLKDISSTYDKMIEHLKSKITPIEDNINRDIMLGKEEGIKSAEKGSEYKNIRFWSELNAGVFMGVTAHAILNDLHFLLPYTITHAALALYLESKYKKNVVSEKILRQADYIELLQAMAENENHIQYPVKLGEIENFNTVKLITENLDDDHIITFCRIKDGKLQFVNYSSGSSEIHEFDLDDEDFSEDDFGKEK